MGNRVSIMSFDEYNNLKKSGMFWELYPEASGIYYVDKLRSLVGEFKIELEICPMCKDQKLIFKDGLCGYCWGEVNC